MKWIILILLLATNTVGQELIDTILVDGGSITDGSWAFIPRWPPYDYWSESSDCEIGVSINSPVVKNYSSNNIDVNYTVTGAVNPTCRYKINDNDWNIIPDCENKTITFTPGGNTLTVQAYTSEECLAEDSVGFEVLIRVMAGPIDEWFLLLLPLLLATYFFVIDT